ncbi:unnamed protein product [Phaedon cochleariae]|uniref:RING-type E3 ubiquitin transferase n=1 Tax=Phaedon cochleariae TaxID=80249 RepID=A0A9N9SBD9_PHACE|nr:unnamed protein product [Phaedon cochleariae]
MYIKIQNLCSLQGEGSSHGGKSGTDYTIINISKMASINKLKEMIEEELAIKAEVQKLLHKGKELVNDHRVVDYNIKLDDIIQLMITTPKTDVEDDKKKVDIKITKPKKEQYKEAQSKFYKVGDLIDVLLVDNGAWYEAYVHKILKTSDDDEVDENDLIFRVRNASHVISFETDAKFDDIRPRSSYCYKTSELEKGMIVLANYNTEEKKSRGHWYDFEVEGATRTSVKGTLLVGRDKTRLENCSLKFVNEIMRIEKPKLLSDQSQDEISVTNRKYPVNCEICKDVPNKKCKECGCRVCRGKDSCDTMILCDECDYGYHISCLNPPLESVPDEDEWYCPECKTDDSEIVKAGEKLKESKKKAKMASSKGECSRDWGNGMACVGRTKVCTIVLKNHYGPIPGVDVGTCWAFRMQVSEVGIHRPHVAGIHGREKDGAYSIVLSGGYEDDIDEGEEFLYTGSGGRDLSGNKRCGHQSSNQKLTRMNKALALNCYAKFNNQVGAESEEWEKGKPVRVVRNYNAAKHSKYAPKAGNRYDGLYKVVKYYPEKGKSGFIVWRYLLRRDDKEPAPWEEGGKESDVIYPDGYLEAEEAKEAKEAREAEEQKKNKENTPSTSGTSNRGSKRKKQDLSKPLADFFKNTPKKKPKLEQYELPDDVKSLIEKDTVNDKDWSECKETLKDGKKAFLDKVGDIFKCIFCLEVVFEPVTTECGHNFCKACLKRAFTADCHQCPCCRKDLGKGLEINEKLSETMKLLFPGYEATR